MMGSAHAFRARSVIEAFSSMVAFASPVASKIVVMLSGRVVSVKPVAIATHINVPRLTADDAAEVWPLLRLLPVPSWVVEEALLEVVLNDPALLRLPIGAITCTTKRHTLTTKEMS